MPPVPLSTPPAPPPRHRILLCASCFHLIAFLVRLQPRRPRRHGFVPRLPFVFPRSIRGIAFFRASHAFTSSHFLCASYHAAPAFSPACHAANAASHAAQAAGAPSSHSFVCFMLSLSCTSRAPRSAPPPPPTPAPAPLRILSCASCFHLRLYPCQHALSACFIIFISAVYVKRLRCDFRSNADEN